MGIELPKGFKSWLQLWQKMEAEGKIKGDEISITPPVAYSPYRGDTKVTIIHLRVSDIKEMLLKELLEKTRTIDGFTFNELRSIQMGLVGSGFFSPIANIKIDEKIRKQLNHLYDTKSEYEEY